MADDDGYRLEHGTMGQQGRIERGQMVLGYYGDSLARLLTDLHAFAEQELGPSAFANNVQIACTRNGHQAPAWPDPDQPEPAPATLGEVIVLLQPATPEQLGRIAEFIVKEINP